MLEDIQVHDNEEFSDEELNFSSSRFFVLVLKVIQMHDDIEFCSSLSNFLIPMLQVLRTQ
jgi:hypothetical protein